MQKDVSPYTLDSLKAKIMSSRSIFYSIEPMGLGTAYVESLTSYFCRLAVLHNVTILNLLNKYFIQIINSNNAFNTPFFYYSRNLNGFTPNVIKYVKALNILTGRNDLEELTFLSCQNILNLKGLLKKTKSYCPVCYQENQKNGLVVYDQLLWTCKPINICPIHNIKLLDYCHYDDCKKPLLFIDNKSLPGYCSKCHRWLGISESHINPNNNIIENYELQISNEISDLILEMRKIKNQTYTGKFVSSLNYVKDQYCDNSIIKLSKLLSFDKHNLKRYLTGIKPNIEYLVLFCKRFNMSLAEFVEGGLDYKLFEVKTDIQKEDFIKDKIKRIKIDSNILEQSLNVIINQFENKTPPSLEEVAKIIGISSSTIRYKFPNIAKSIVVKRYQYNKKQKEKRLGILYEDIRNATIEIFNMGKYPAQVLVTKFLGRPKVFMSPIATKVWRETLIDLGIKIMT